MSRVAVLGAGAGGRSAAVELTHAGHDVALWNRSRATVASILLESTVLHHGVMGDGSVQPALVTTDLCSALDGAEVAVVCLPALAHRQLFTDLAGVRATMPMVLNPGQTGGALHARAVFGELAAAQPPTAELSTLSYIARVGPDGSVTTTARARMVRVGCLPGHSDAVDWALRLFPGTVAVPDVMASSLSNVNLVLHPPGAVLAAAWVEATGGDFRFYVDAMTPAVTAVLQQLDDERLAVAKAYGHTLPGLVEEMAAIGSADPAAAAAGDVRAAIRAGVANEAIRAPESFEHRYYREDLPFGLKPFLAFARLAGVDVPIAGALLKLGSAVAGIGSDVGLDEHRLGLAQLSLADVRRLVGRAAAGDRVVHS